MSTLVLIHVVAGLAGILSGLVVIAAIVLRRRAARWNATFLSTTAAACLTGLVFLPIDGMTSAQVVAIFAAALLAVATYARYVQKLHGDWNRVYAVSVVGAFFSNVLIAIAQSFLHFQWLRAFAPTQRSAAYVAVKATLFLVCVAVVSVVVRRGVGHPPGDARADPPTA